jgi:hypothetical protein
MLAVGEEQQSTGAGATSSRLRVAEWACWLLCVALLASAALALSGLARLGGRERSPVDLGPDLPPVVLRVQDETDRLIEAIQTGDEAGAAAGRTRLLAEVDEAAAALERPRQGGQHESAGGPGTAGSLRGRDGAAWGRAYALAAVASARGGALAGDPRQLAHAATLFRRANRSVADPLPAPARW